MHCIPKAGFMKNSIVYKGIRKAIQLPITLIAKTLPLWKKAATLEVHSSMLFVPVSLPVNHAKLPKPFARHFIDIKHIPKRRIFVLEDVWVGGEAVVFKNLQVFVPSLTWLRDLDRYRTGSLLIKQWRPGIEKVSADKTVALVYDNWSCYNYYHWMIESLPRLLLVQHKYPDSLFFVPDPCPAYISRTLDLMGITKQYPLKKKKEQVVKVPRLALPELVYYYQQEEINEVATEEEIKAATTAQHGVQHSKGIPPAEAQQEELIVTVRNKLLQAFGSRSVVPTRRVYVSRAKQKTRRLTNEEALMPILRKWGFEVVYFEGMSLDEQIMLMQETKILMGVHGANMVNILFLNQGARIIEMMNQDHFNEAYYILASSFALPYYSVPCTMSDKTITLADDTVILNNADLLVNVSELEEAIAACIRHMAAASLED